MAQNRRSHTLQSKKHWLFCSGMVVAQSKLAAIEIRPNDVNPFHTKKG